MKKCAFLACKIGGKARIEAMVKKEIGIGTPIRPGNADGKKVDPLLLIAAKSFRYDTVESLIDLRADSFY